MATFVTEATYEELKEASEALAQAESWFLTAKRAMFSVSCALTGGEELDTSAEPYVQDGLGELLRNVNNLLDEVEPGEECPGCDNWFPVDDMDTAYHSNRRLCPDCNRVEDGLALI